MISQPPRSYVTVVIEQLDADSKVFRTFRLYPTHKELKERLSNIRRAYRMESTRVTVDGKVNNTFWLESEEEYSGLPEGDEKYLEHEYGE